MSETQNDNFFGGELISNPERVFFKCSVIAFVIILELVGRKFFRILRQLVNNFDDPGLFFPRYRTNHS